MIKVSDYIFKRLANKYNVKHVFMITGGGAMHLNDSIGCNPAIKYICNHHEQASAIAAEGYSRTSGKLGVVNVTTGPGGLNTLTGVMGQWTDSVPVLYISGQVKQETTITPYSDLNLRQLGDQEVDIISVVKSLTKFSEQITDIRKIKYFIDKAVYLATEGRPGPVWLDIPMNIQGARMDENDQEEFIEPNNTSSKLDISKVVELLEKAERPLIIAGNGIKISKSNDEFLSLLNSLQIPVVTTFNGMDILDEDNSLYVGRIGTLGNRSGNFALQNADVVLCLGSRNNIRQVSYNWDFFVREGKLILVDIDENELKKPTVHPFLSICSDLKDFIPALNNYFSTNILERKNWVEWCITRKIKYPSVLPEYATEKRAVHPYYFFEKFSESISDNSIVVCGNGSACVAAFQAAKVIKNQKYLWNSGCASMGYDLPAAIGAAVANPDKDIYCVAGDGSLMMNLQELETISHLRQNIKVIVLDNGGYISIKQTQSNFFNNRETGCGCDSGVGFPDFAKVAEAFNLKTLVVENHEDLSAKLKELSNTKGSLLCVVKCITDYIFAPKVSSKKMPDGRMISKPLEDLYPFLPEEEFLQNMIVKPIKE